jgi:hypothetical protein
MIVNTGSVTAIIKTVNKRSNYARSGGGVSIVKCTGRADSSGSIVTEAVLFLGGFGKAAKGINSLPLSFLVSLLSSVFLSVYLQIDSVSALNPSLTGSTYSAVIRISNMDIIRFIGAAKKICLHRCRKF